MKRILAALLAMLMGATTVDAAGFTVGTDVSENSITDFYYTVDASYYPPLYQRYRFYVQDGKKWFFHESRQGGGWPQMEEDIVASGTLEITDEIWAEFAACLAGGRVKAREEHLEDGDSGPWTYLLRQTAGIRSAVQKAGAGSCAHPLLFRAGRLHDAGIPRSRFA